MSDEELIKWLRETDVPNTRAAADALEAQARRIEELEVELKVRLPIQEYKAHLKARIAELEAENTVLRRKLELYAATYLSARVIFGEKE